MGPSKSLSCIYADKILLHTYRNLPYDCTSSVKHQNPTGQEAEQLIVLRILPFPGSSSHHAGFHADGCLLDGSEVVLHGLSRLIPTRLQEHLK